MTEDPRVAHVEPGLGNNEAEMYAALWALAPFPRLPDDAPAEIKDLAIDIHEPKRVYAVYKAARRHQFQVLVERFIYQIRYGCQSPCCHTLTCFSYRKRLADGAPVRRYNATSARTLAIHLASQDNAERHLCTNPRVGGSSSHIQKSQASNKGVVGEPRIRSKSQDGLTPNSHMDASPKLITTHAGKTTNSSRSNGTSSKSIREPVTHDSIKDLPSKLRNLEGSVKIDHRSFVQNVFETAAFKMVEWLAPRTLQTLASDEIGDRKGGTHPDLPSLPERPISKRQSLPVEKTNFNVENTKTEASSQPEVPKPQQRASTTASRKPKAVSAQRPDSFFTPSIEERPTIRRKNSHLRTSSESLEHHNVKGPLHHPPKTAELELSHFTQVKSPKQKIVRQALISSPATRLDESPPPEDRHERCEREQEIVNIPSTNQEANPRNESIHHVAVDAEIVQEKPKKRQNERKRQTKPRTIPQSLSYLTVEIIQILCDIMEANGICEKHNLQPQKILKDIQVTIVDQETATPVSRPEMLRTNRQRTKYQWLSFTEQSFFDVLGKPESLLRSFRKEGRLFDNLSTWYLMLRMTRVAPSIVLNSLWHASGSLYMPPTALETSYDWAKHCPNLDHRSSQSLSDFDAAHVVSLCLSALVAAVPLVRDSRKLMNMSRIRSYGQSMLGGDSFSLEPVDLCLQYEDAFTNEYAMRLARRVFAAIPTRRRFTELLELKKEQNDAACSDPDILDLILETIKSDISVQPALNFQSSETNVHETRVCTLILDWARTVMIQEWQGSAEVPMDGAFGGALMTIAAIYQNRKSLLLGDIHFQTQYFADRLDPVTMPREWAAFIPNNKTIHLLDHPYLFNLEVLVTYFRAINFSQMNHAYETSKATSGLMSTAMSGSHNLMLNRHRRQRLFDQLRTATSTFLVLEIRRTNVLFDAFNSIWRREERELQRPIKLRLGEDDGEEGLDAGGVQQEFFVLAIAEALDPNYGTFTVDERTRMTWFQPSSPEPLWKFELIGTIISLAVYNGLTLPITFPKALYQRLLGEEVNELHHIADGWPDLAAGLTTLLEWNEAEGAVEDVFARTYEFSVSQFGQNVSRDMAASTNWPQFSNTDLTSDNPEDAPLVTNANRNSYVSDYIRWLTDVSVRPQFEAFKRGFFTCFSPRSISLFDASTLQSLVEGVQDIDIAELRRITRYIGWDASHRAVRDFWSVVKKFDFEEKKKLLEFCTASDRVPVGGMRNLQFTLQKNGVGDTHLPTSYTCFGILLLPEYSGKEALKEKLGMALENAKGFGFA